MTTAETIDSLIAANALFVINHSGGKDSQAMMIRLLAIVPREQLLVVHASLGEIEWHGALELAQQQATDAGVPFIVARARDKAGNGKSFFDLVERRFATRPEVPSFPSSEQRQCTSDLKRGPIEREVIAYMKAHGFTRVVNCEGLRAAESHKRAKLVDFHQRGVGKKDALARAGRLAWNWLPIFTLSTADVFATIAAAGQTAHPAYAAGNERLSCVFCIMGSANDIARGALARPELFARYVELEARTGYTMHQSRKSLAQIVAEAAI